MKNWIENNQKGCLIIIGYLVFLIIVPFIVGTLYRDTNRELSDFAFTVLFLSVGVVGWQYEIHNKKRKR